MDLSLYQLRLLAPFTRLCCLTLTCTSPVFPLIRSYCRPQPPHRSPPLPTASWRRLRSRGKSDTSDVSDDYEMLESTKDEEGVCELEQRLQWGEGGMDGRAALFDEVARRVSALDEEKAALRAVASSSASTPPSDGVEVTGGPSSPVPSSPSNKLQKVGGDSDRANTSRKRKAENAA